MAEELGARPEPTTQEPELHPGGPDSLEDEEKYGGWLDEPTPRDLDPEKNPAVDDEAPEEISEPDEEKKQAPQGAADDQDADTERDPEAGQENEEGDPEEPA